MTDKLFFEMKQGNIDSIKIGLSSKALLDRINGIIYAVHYKIDDNEIITKIIHLKDDHIYFMSGYKVSDFAIAALELLNVEKYDGSDKSIISLIESKFSIVE